MPIVFFYHSPVIKATTNIIAKEVSDASGQAHTTKAIMMMLIVLLLAKTILSSMIVRDT